MILRPTAEKAAEMLWYASMSYLVRPQSWASLSRREKDDMYACATKFLDALEASSAPPKKPTKMSTDDMQTVMERVLAMPEVIADLKTTGYSTTGRATVEMEDVTGAYIIKTALRDFVGVTKIDIGVAKTGDVWEEHHLDTPDSCKAYAPSHVITVALLAELKYGAKPFDPFDL